MVEKQYCIPLQTPYAFEGKDYREIDLNGLSDLTTNDLIFAQRQLIQMGVVTSLPEFDYTYCCLVAAAASKHPYEFFANLPARAGVRVRGMVSNFLSGMG